jgi:hypothetical protein
MRLKYHTEICMASPTPKIEPLYINGDLNYPDGNVMEVWPGCWLHYTPVTNRLVLGKLDFHQDKQDPVVRACKREVYGANTLEWIYSGSMEALTLSADERGAIKDIQRWFNSNYSRYRFDLFTFR